MTPLAQRLVDARWRDFDRAFDELTRARFRVDGGVLALWPNELRVRCKTAKVDALRSAATEAARRLRRAIFALELGLGPAWAEVEARRLEVVERLPVDRSMTSPGPDRDAYDVVVCPVRERRHSIEEYRDALNRVLTWTRR